VVAVGAHFFLKGDRLTVLKMLGLLLAFSGISLVFLGRPKAGKPTMFVGDILLLSGGHRCLHKLLRVVQADTHLFGKWALCLHLLYTHLRGPLWHPLARRGIHPFFNGGVPHGLPGDLLRELEEKGGKLNCN